MDFDGVVADSQVLAYSVAQTICRHVTREVHDRAFEGNINMTDHDHRKADHGPECNHGLHWWDVYTPRFAEVKPFDGAREMLESVSHEYGIIVVSSTVSNLIDGFLKEYDMSDFILEVMGNDVHKLKTEKIRMAMEKHGATVNECVFVTDTLGDMREAKEHEMGAIGCSWGYHPRSALEKGIPFRIVDSPAELPDAVDDYFARI